MQVSSSGLLCCVKCFKLHWNSYVLLHTFTHMNTLYITRVKHNMQWFRVPWFISDLLMCYLILQQPRLTWKYIIITIIYTMSCFRGITIFRGHFFCCLSSLFDTIGMVGTRKQDIAMRACGPLFRPDCPTRRWAVSGGRMVHCFVCMREGPPLKTEALEFPSACQIEYPLVTGGLNLHDDTTLSSPKRQGYIVKG